ncbi:MAG: adenosine deaminase [Candidatus Marinimicrobia bacterium]|nr:adenosine deaminase [Candidatus Neomarinimicrobiota bacterium]
MTWYNKIPKIELHVHLEGAIPYDALFELIKKYGGDPSVPDIPSLIERFEYKNFTQFIETWFWKNNFLREYEDFAYIAELTARDMNEQNIRYAEMFFSPSIFTGKGKLNVQDLTDAVRKGFSKVPEIEISLIADLVRDYGPKTELRILEKLNEVKDKGVIGIGIGGSEHEFPPKPFAGLYEKARNMGFHTNAHAGEAAGPKSIWEAIQYLHIERIGHGTRAIEDEKLMDYLVEHAIPLELCPGSNSKTGVIDDISDHPIRKYFDHGLIFSVNTDDPKMFGTSLENEYESLENILGFSKQEICKIILLGIESSWLEKDQKKILAASFRRSPVWVEEG